MEDCIKGVGFIRSSNKIDFFRQELCDLLYKSNSVYTINDRYILKAMSVLSDIASIGIIYGISAVAIGIKNKMG